jgi:hypothetical protein
MCVLLILIMLFGCGDVSSESSVKVDVEEKPVKRDARNVMSW